MILTAKPLAALVTAILFGGIFFSSAMGWWQTESTKQAAVFTEGEFAGEANPADIRGSYTFGDVENNFGVPAELLAQAFGVTTDDAAAFPVKSLETLYQASPEEVGTASVRLFVAFYKHLPLDLSTRMYLPESAAALLRQRGLTSEQAAYLEAHTVANLSPALPAVEGGGEVHGGDSGTLIKGKTTFADVLAWGVSPEAVERALGVPLPAARGMTIKDFCMQNGLSFEPVKTALQAEVDKLK